MKQRYLIAIVILMTAFITTALIVPRRVVLADEGDIEINETNFPDEYFRLFVRDYDVDNDGYLNTTEIENTTEITCTDGRIESLEGIKFFTSLVSLDCSVCQLTNLDVSDSTSLVNLDCGYIHLESLNASNCTNLSELSVYYVNNLDLSGCVSLVTLTFYSHCDIRTIDISNCTSLTSFYCFVSSLDSLDASNCTNLSTLEVDSVNTYDLSGCPSLDVLHYGENTMVLTNGGKYYTYIVAGAGVSILNSTVEVLYWTMLNTDESYGISPSQASIYILDKEYTPGSINDSDILYYFSIGGFSGFNNKGSFTLPSSLDVNEWGTSYYVYLVPEAPECSIACLGNPVELYTPVVYPSEVILNQTTYTLTAGTSCPIDISVLPANADRDLIFYTSNHRITYVQDGNIIAVSQGRTSIEVYYGDPEGNHTTVGYITVVVNPVPVNISNLSLYPRSINLTEGSTQTLVTNISPSNATCTDINWTSGDNSIAIVQNGVVGAISPGTTTITATATNGTADESDDIIAVCSVTVRHNPEVDEAVDPTCTETGLTAGSHCSVCGEVLVEQEVVPANGHTSVDDPAVDPTCTETGLTAGSHCSVCGEVFVEQEVVPANGHTSVDDPAVDPTCTETGLTAGSNCSVCGEVFVEQEVVPANGHTSVDDPAVDPTCSETGLTAGSHCSVCGSIIVAQEEIPTIEHTPIIDDAVEPTNAETGLTEGSHCSVCGIIIVAQEIIPATGESNPIIPNNDPTNSNDDPDNPGTNTVDTNDGPTIPEDASTNSEINPSTSVTSPNTSTDLAGTTNTDSVESTTDALNNDVNVTQTQTSEPSSAESYTPAPAIPSTPSTGGGPVVTSSDYTSFEHTTEGFIDRLYFMALGRDSDEIGAQNWLNLVESGRATGADLVRGFLFSPEFLGMDISDEDFVDLLYHTIFGRNPDPVGRAHWLNILRRNHDRSKIINGFIDSIEWYNLCESFGIESGSAAAPRRSST